MQVAPLWFLAQYTFNTSLHLTSVTSNTILSNSSALFTYGLSWALLQEPFVAHKLASILVCATGALPPINSNLKSLLHALPSSCSVLSPPRMRPSWTLLGLLRESADWEGGRSPQEKHKKRNGPW